MVAVHRRRRRRRAPSAVVRSDGDGYLIGVELEARLFGRIRLLTVEATAAISDGSRLVLDLPPESRPPRPVDLQPLPARRSVPSVERSGLAEASALVREARALTPHSGSVRT